MKEDYASKRELVPEDKREIYDELHELAYCSPSFGVENSFRKAADRYVQAEPRTIPDSNF